MAGPAIDRPTWSVLAISTLVTVGKAKGFRPGPRLRDNWLRVTRVLVLTRDYVNQKMAGPAIRSFEVSKQLHKAGHEVTLAIPNRTDLATPPFRVATYHDGVDVEAIAQGQEVVFFQGYALADYPFLKTMGARLVPDLYGPFYVELLVTRKHDPEPDRLAEPEGALRVTNDQLRLGDFFVCASEKQRDYWLGGLTAMNRVNTLTFAEDQSLRSLIEVMPFGLPSEPPQKQGPAMRGVIPGIGQEDLILLWGSSIYNWFDPITLIRGVAKAAERHPNLRMVVMSSSHPNPKVTRHSVESDARRCAQELGLTGKHVFFNEGWVPYERRADWYLEADVGVSTHEDHIEARWAFRTRFLDYFWTGLPLLCTAGDTLGEDVTRHGMGLAVPPQDPDAIAAAIDKLADPAYRASCSEAVKRYASELTWDKAARPLVHYCDNPRRAPDLAATEDGLTDMLVSDFQMGATTARKGVRYYIVRAVDTALFEGPAGITRRSVDVVRRRREARREARSDT